MFCTAQQSKVMCLFCLSCFGSFFSFLLLFPPSFYLLLLYSIQFLSYSTVLVFNLISLWYKIIWTYFSQHRTYSNLSSWADFLLSSAISISSSLLLLYCLLSLFILFTLLHQFHLLLSSDLHLKWKKKNTFSWLGSYMFINTWGKGRGAILKNHTPKTLQLRWLSLCFAASEKRMWWITFITTLYSFLPSPESTQGNLANYVKVSWEMWAIQQEQMAFPTVRNQY